MEAYTINIYPIFKMFVILFAVVGVFDVIKTIANLTARAFKDKLDNKKDIHAKDCDADITQDLIQVQAKYPDVKQEFILLPEKMQNVENNQEIFKLFEKYDELDNKLEKIEFQLSQLNIRQSMTLDEVKGKRK